MNFDPTTQKLVRAWMHAHVNFVREVVRRLQAVSDAPIGQPFNGDDEEYLVTQDGHGYHVEHEVDMSNGMIKFNAIPGRFVQSSIGEIWINGRTRLHDEIERKCDQRETSLIIQ